jgi:hypothetical protein
MAQDQKKPPVGGNKPKPGTSSAGSSGQSAKDRSRAQSRPVTGKAPAGKSGKATGAAKSGGGGNRSGGGNKPRSGGRPAPAAPKRTLSGAAMAWGAVGLVLVIIVVLVVVKAASGNGPTSSSHQEVRPAPASLVHTLTTVPTSVFDSVGADIPAEFTGNQPIVISGQPPLTLNGKAPSMMYYGAEYCPFCAAERWAMILSLSRFGTFHGLDTTASGLQDGDYSTFSFRNATYDSPYINFVPIEACTNVVDPNASGCNGYKPLETPTKAEAAVLSKYASSQFVPDNTQGIAFPYINVDNKVLFSGATYEPGGLTGQSQAEIASALKDPTNPVTQAIVATSNYLSAAICSATNQQPGSVCQSHGVTAAAKAMKLG